MPLRASLLSFLLLFSPLLLASPTATGQHIEVALVSEHQKLKKNVTNWVGLYLQPEQQWHTYWRNPGDSGEPPRIDWQLPAGVSAGDILWPIPQAIDVAHLTNYGYEGNNLLMVPLTLGESVQGPVQLIADVSWLVCKEDCIPGWATLSLNLEVSDTTQPSEHAGLFAQTRQQLPLASDKQASHEFADNQLLVSISGVEKDQWRLFPFRSDLIQHAGEQQAYREGDTLTLSIEVSDYLNQPAESFDFLLSDGKQGLYLQSTLRTGPVGNNAATATATPLYLYLLMAFAGGLILNIMPCVFPILCFKAMSLKQQSPVQWQHLGYATGIFVSFWLFALVISLLKLSGQTVGWGFHLQNPLIIALLTYLFFAIGLMLLNTLPVGSRLAGLGDKLTRGQGFGSQFFTGVLAVIVASPCTAPFMAAALGVAMVSDMLTSWLIFSFLALGFALPLTLLVMLPSLNRLLPKPGSWMEHFKQLLAFPIFATCVWLLWIYQHQVGGTQQAMLMLGLLAIALLCWQCRLGSKTGRVVLIICAVALIISPLIWPASENKVERRDTLALNFSPDRLRQLQQDNQVILLNMTADWCISCKVNEQTALSSERVRQALQQPDTHYMVGDWTNKNQQILEFLNHYQRSGVPLYVVYGGTSHVEILPQLLTVNMVIDALNRAKKEIKQ
ncbi:protein-disulfide reductase DsbD family protein [Lacimicrobium alkaliphilum]|uniref:Uncharacterized protein n=1 Tax=Lacimicrobium alkaliphilum TaxID=1526571 RepID=A0A0U3B5M1_9ALTE|nr:protein-disulfide reductase DsbD domain-containing protein [Lacimicrobium alkaliphilum]ALS98889.1 hypothetical protein AT746_11815 [Lacimicrobium alkaliphilum]